MTPRCLRRRRMMLALFLGLLAAVLPAGCANSNTGNVAGRVTLGDKPVTEGSVLFEDAAAGISVHAALQSDGSYEVKTYDRDGLPPGTYKVAVTPSKFGDGDAPLVSNSDAQAAAASATIPERYTRTATSELSVSVVAGDNPPFDFKLQP